VLRLNEPARRETVVSLDHRKAADALLGGKLTNRRQLRAREHAARADHRFDLTDDLFGQRHAGAAVDVKRKCIHDV